jgi:hypothetical protein
MAFAVDMKVTPSSEAAVINTLAKLAAEYGVEFEFVAADQLRLLVAAMMRFSPPHSGKRGSFVKKEEGFQAVKTDLLNMFVPVKASVFNEARVVQNGPLAGMRIIADPEKGTWAFSADHDRPGMSLSGMRRLHLSKRNSKGRVPEQRANSKVGGITVIHKTHVKSTEFNKYLSAQKKHVLRLASSWLPAYKALARMTRSAANPKGVPMKSLKKVPGGQRGSLHNRIKGIDGGALVAISSAGFGTRKWDSMLPSLLSERRRDVNVNLEKRMGKIAKRFNAGAV